MENQKEIKEFLKESNAIEGVYDKDSLQQALYAWQYLINEEEIHTGVVKKTHKILMLHQPLRPDELGYFRKCPVYIGRKEAMNWKKIEKEIKDWCMVMNITDPVHDWKNLHVLYEKVHPFVDGNGRTGRMFMNWYRLKIGLPLLIIHEGKEQMKYYKWFK